MSSEQNTVERVDGVIPTIAREANSLILAVTIIVVAYILLQWGLPRLPTDNLGGWVRKYVGRSWPFFLTVAVFLAYVAGAWIVEVFALGVGRYWTRISRMLHWATEACPLVGLLTTFLSLLIALAAYGEAGPGDPRTQAAFMGQFAIAFGSSIAGGILSLIAFTLHRLIPEDVEAG